MRRFGTVVTVLAWLLISEMASAQGNRGIVAGRAIDSKGGVLQGASVELQPAGATGTTNTQGEFTIPDVAPGAQKLTVTFVGFSPASSDITVTAGQTTRAEITLQVGAKNEEVLVTAERPHSEAEAINRERTAINLLQVLPADVITSLPNANVADALGRLPSVTLERDEGEGKYVQIRGAEPRYSNVTIDGVNVPSPENVRQIKLDIIQSDLVESVEINKTLLASGDGDAIGGSVNLRTKSAGERPTLTLYGLGGYTPIVGGRGEDQFGGTMGKRFGKEKKLGILFGGSYDYNGRGIDDIEPAPQTASLTSSSPVFGTYAGADLREYRYERTRYGFSGTMDYKLSDVSSIYVRGLFSHFNNFGDRWVYSPGINSYVANPSAGGIPQGGGDGTMSFNAQIRRPMQTVGSLSVGGQSFVGRNTFAYEISGARASTEDKGYSQANFGPIADASPLNNVQFGINLANPYRPAFPVLNGVNIYDPKQYFLTDYDYNTLYSPQVNLQAGASYSRSYNLGGHLGVFEMGGKFRNAHKFNEASDVFYKANNPGSLPLSNFLTSFTNNNYYDGSYQLGPLADFNSIRSFYQGTPGAFSVNASKTFARNTPQTWDLLEHVGAGYFQNSISFGKWRVYAGLRFEATGEGVRGTLVEGTKAIPVNRDSNYVDPMPSVQVRRALTSESAIRIGYGRGIARPDFSSLVPGGTVTDSSKKISAGNPDLKATYANNYDILYEHFLKPLGHLQAGFFYKDIQQPVYVINTPVTTGTFAGFTQTAPVNGTNAKLYGFEFAYQQRLSFLPGVLGGVGIAANYGYTASQANGVPGRSDQPALQRQAPHTWNLSPTYDRGRLSVRMGLSYNAANIFAYNYTDGADLGKTGPNGDNYLYAHLQVDAQASFRLNHGFTAVVSGLNLTNEVFGFYNGSPIWVVQREYYKPTIAVGVRWSLPNER
jgi:TonB-dependent receptor